MSSGKFTDYYWRLRAFLAEKGTILDKAHPDYRFPEDDSPDDNSPHHPELTSHPHHVHGDPDPGKEKTEPLSWTFPGLISSP